MEKEKKVYASLILEISRHAYVPERLQAVYAGSRLQMISWCSLTL